jgi:hypothetical protein
MKMNLNYIDIHAGITQKVISYKLDKMEFVPQQGQGFLLLPLESN